MSAKATLPPTPFVLPTTGFVREKNVLELMPFGHTTLWLKIKRGEFPKPVKLTERITAWRAEEIRQWIELPRPRKPLAVSDAASQVGVG